MKNYKNSVKLTLALTYLMMLALAVLVVALPYLATWYVEEKNRPADLATVSMLTCYPCVPFATISLFSLRKLLKNILNGDIVSCQNKSCLKRIGLCCLVSGAIMLFAGFFYKPFFVSGAAAFVCALLIKVIYDIMRFYLAEDKDRKNKELKEEKD